MKAGVAEARSVARVKKARAEASVVEARARVATEAVMAVAVAVAKVVEAWVEARVEVSAVEARAGVTAVLSLLHREAPSALIVRGMPPVGWAPTFGADSGFWHELLWRAGAVLAQPSVGVMMSGGKGGALPADNRPRPTTRESLKSEDLRI